MKRCLCLLVSIVVASSVHGQTLEWAHSIGGAFLSLRTYVAVDDSGTAYVTGYFDGTRDFDPSIEALELSSDGAAPDIFISKFSANGSLEFAKRIGGANFDLATAIAIDSEGNFFITGQFNDTVDFDPDTGVAILISNGDDDIFVAKYDSDGNYMFAKSIGAFARDRGIGITVDSGGNVLVTGFFAYTADFDPGVGTSFLTSNGEFDVFILKLDNDGNFVLAKNIGGNISDTGNDIASDNSNSIYVTGTFQDTVDFDASLNESIGISNGMMDLFLAKYDSLGQFDYVVSVGSSTVDVGRSLDVDDEGNVYLTGDFMETVDFDPGPNLQNLVSNGDADAFIARYDSHGELSFVFSMGDFASDGGRSIKVDSEDNLYVVGDFSGSLDIDPGTDVVTLSSEGFGNTDFFMAKYTTSGEFVGAKSIGGYIMGNLNSDTGNSVDVDASGNIYVSGLFSATVDFDPGPAIVNIQSQGPIGSYVAKFASPILSVPEVVKNKLKLYPNPVKDLLTLQSETPLTVAWLTDLTGRRIGELKQNGSIWQSNLATLPNGVYIIETVDNQGNLLTYKVVKCS